MSELLQMNRKLSIFQVCEVIRRHVAHVQGVMYMFVLDNGRSKSVNCHVSSNMYTYILYKGK